MRTILSAALMAAFSLAAFSGAAQAEECITPAEYEAAMAVVMPGTAPLEHLTDGLAAAFMAAYNAHPPPSDIPSDEVLLYALRINGVAAIFFSGGCLVERNTVYRPALIEIREHAQAIFDGGGV